MKSLHIRILKLFVMLLRFRLFLALAGLIAIPLQIWADAFSQGKYKYETIDDVSVRVVAVRAYSEEMEIPSVVTYAGKQYSCTEIGSYAFRDNDVVRKVVIGENVITVSQYAFYSCSSLQELVISKTVTSLNLPILASCANLTEISVAEDNPSVTSVEGIVYSKDQKKLLIYPKKKVTNWVGLPEGLEEIGEYVFSSTQIQRVCFPSTLKRIEKGAFYKCELLDSIVLPASVQKLGSSAFSSCAGLLTIKIEGVLSQIGENCFSSCPFEAIEFESNITSLPYEVFANCKNLKSYTIPSTIKDIGDRAFSGCLSLERVSFPSSLERISSSAFSGDSQLCSVDLSSTSLFSIGNRAFSGCKELYTVLLPESVSIIGDYAFSESGLQEFVIPSKVTKVNEGLFYNAKNLASVILSEAIQSIGAYAFSGCESMKNIIIPNSVEILGNGVFSGCAQLEEFRVPEKVTAISNSMFGDCINLKNVVLPSQVRTIGSYAFYNCKLLDSIALPRTARDIGEGCFKNCESLQELFLPLGMKEIPRFIIDGCSNLRKLSFGVEWFWSSWNFPNDLQSGYIYGDAFTNCPSLEELHCYDLELRYLTEYQYMHACFGNTDMSKITLYVPMETSEVFNGLNSGFKEIVEEETPIAETFLSEGFTCVRHLDDRMKVDIIDYPTWIDYKLSGDVILPENVTYAGEELTVSGLRCSDLFKGLTSIYIPKTYEYIGGNEWFEWVYGMCPFEHQPLKSINVDKENPYFFSDQGVLYYTKDSLLLHIPYSLSRGDTLVTHYSIPEGIKGIMAINQSYEYGKVKHLSIPASVDTIYMDAFSNIIIDTISIYRRIPPKDFILRDVDVLYVPYKCIQSYQSLFAEWPVMPKIIEMPNDEPVTIFANSYSRVYGEPNPIFDFSSLGGELCGMPDVYCAATEDSPAGEYPI